MEVLLLSMPDSFEHMAPVAIRMPNGALGSLAANVDPHHRVAVADLVLVQGRVAATVESLVRERQPDVVGLSVMTFQRRTAQRVVRLVRALRPQARIVVGGYDPSLAPEAWARPEDGSDFIVRGEGEVTFRHLLRALEAGGGRESLAEIPGLWWNDGDGFRRNPDRPVMRLKETPPALPNRSARLLRDFALLGRPVDVVETSRGCTFDCSFCSIIEMRGRNFHVYPVDRVLDDIRDARRHGARAVFFVDDNITLDVRRFEAICRAIVDAGLDDIDYVVQATTASIADHGATLAPLMRRAGFRYVFLGIENILEDDLAFLKARAKNHRREGSRRVANATLSAVDHIRRNGMYVVGGLIVGNPADTRESIEANLEFARRHVDWPYIQHPMPYPGTRMADDLRERGLVVNDDMTVYDGTTAVVRSEQVGTDEIEFLRWKAERWMKLRHFPVALRHSPGFCLRHGAAMIGHTFRGCTWRTFLGLENERLAFERYRSIRAAEREAMWGPPASAEPGRSLAQPTAVYPA
ncbi:MAG TPA: radical SAM protein [Vicinamibacteria bacterium]|nr:radical SAM protein [Vicinamibacteria bacterium]